MLPPFSRVAPLLGVALATCAIAVAIAQEPAPPSQTAPQPAAARPPSTRETWLSAKPNTAPAPGVWRIRPNVPEYLAEERSGKLEKFARALAGGRRGRR
jgi:hypothetical protein